MARKGSGFLLLYVSFFAQDAEVFFVCGSYAVSVNLTLYSGAALGWAR